MPFAYEIEQLPLLSNAFPMKHSKWIMYQKKNQIEVHKNHDRIKAFQQS